MNSELIVDLTLFRDVDNSQDSIKHLLGQILSKEMNAKVLVHEFIYNSLDYRFYVTKATIKKE